MCRVCWEEDGSPTDLPDNYEVGVRLIEELYAFENCSVGGPLHVQLEDQNVGLEWVPYNGRPWERPWYSEEELAKAQEICDFMTPLNVAHRRAVVAKWNKYF